MSMRMKRRLGNSRLHVGRITPIIFFVIMPSIAVTTSAINHFIYHIYPLNAIIFFSTIIASFCYSLIRPYYIKMYFKQGLEQALSEYETVKKIIPIIIIITIFGLILYDDSKANGYIYNAVIGFVSGLFNLEENEGTTDVISSLIDFSNVVSG